MLAYAWHWREVVRNDPLNRLNQESDPTKFGSGKPISDVDLGANYDDNWGPSSCRPFGLLPPPTNLMRVPFLSLLVVAICANSILHAADVVGDSIDFAKDVLPVLQVRCIKCHGPEKEEGNIRLDSLSIDIQNDRSALEHWHDVLNVLNAAEMPPKEEPELTSEELRIVTAWLTVSVQKAIDARRQTDGRVVMRRLNRVEYQNTMFDLLGIEMDYARDLPPDAVSADGFQNDGRSLQMSSLQLEYYLSTARRALDKAIVSGVAPKQYDYVFTESKIDGWLGDYELSNTLGRQQQFLAKMVNDYPDDGEFLVRVKLSAEIKPNIGYPLLEVSVGYRPDTEILLNEFPLIEIKTNDSQTFEFRGRLENFPLPVRGQGKYPGLVVRVRNAYSDKSKLPPAQKDENKKTFYAPEPNLPTLKIESVEFHGNAYDQWPPKQHQAILIENSSGDNERPEYISEVIRRFMTRAFRRPVEQEDVKRMVDFYGVIRTEFPSFEEAMRETLSMVLIQPEFLYLLEPASESKRTIDDWELATRLSYFLWSTMPDSRLFELASNGTLHDPSILHQEIDRMLDDPKSLRFVEQFCSQWLSLNVVENVAVSRERYPGFDDTLKTEMCKETCAYFAKLLYENQSALLLIDSDFMMINERLAKHYGVEGVFGQSFQSINVIPDQHRGGLLSQSSILLSNSTGGDSHPVRRAVWIRDRLLNDPPSPPPPNVPTLAEANPEFHKLSVREQLELHRTNEACSNCHRNIDPWGIALENFDAIGKWRTQIRRKVGDKDETIPINAKEELPSGHTVDGLEGLKKHLVTECKDQFAKSLLTRVLSFGLGRTLEIYDQESVEKMSKEFAEDQYRLRGLVHKIVTSEPFQTK